MIRFSKRFGQRFGKNIHSLSNVILASFLAAFLIPSTVHQAFAGESVPSVSNSAEATAAEGTTEADANVDNSEAEEDATGQFTGYFTTILFGPSILNPSKWQPTDTGVVDPDKPVFMKNYLSVGYNLTNNITIAPSLYFHILPFGGQPFVMQDPFLRLSHNSLMSTRDFNWYGDIRAHFGVSDVSRGNDMLAGFQSFHVLTLSVPDSRFTVGTNLSVTGRLYGRQGNGNDVELYAAPNVAYQMTPKVALTAMYEMQTNHIYGSRAFSFVSDASDLEPGIRWEPTPNLLINPYINLYLNPRIIQTASVGMLAVWSFL